MAQSSEKSCFPVWALGPGVPTPTTGVTIVRLVTAGLQQAGQDSPEADKDTSRCSGTKLKGITISGKTGDS